MAPAKKPKDEKLQSKHLTLKEKLEIIEMKDGKGHGFTKIACEKL